MNPRFPIYIVSKGRWETRFTSRWLEEMRVPYFIVVEENQYKEYSAVINPMKVIILDPKYQDEYDVFDDLGRSKSVGPGAARNFAWDHSIAAGHDWHWVMDDNIQGFYRWNNCQKIRLGDGTGFAAMEDFCLRYTNIAMAGPQYEMFAPRKRGAKFPPFLLNSRIYSCNLIRNDVPFRWRGRYNEDTDLSLRMLKAGWCTVEFWAFLQRKINTQKVKGGNHADFYAKDGTAPKSEMLYRMHPDVTRLVMKYGRHHHHVDYSGFKRNVLKKKPGLVIDHSKYKLKTVMVSNG